MDYQVTYNDHGERKTTVISAGNDADAGRIFAENHRHVERDQIVSVVTLRQLAATQRRRLIWGSAYAIAGVIVLLFAQTHKPIDNLADLANAMARGPDAFVLKPLAYYVLIAVGLGLAAMAANAFVKYKKQRPSVNLP